MSHGDRYRELADRLFRLGDDSVIDEMFAPDYTGEHGGRTIQGRDAFRAAVTSVRAALSPCRYDVHDTADSGDLCWAHWTLIGVHGARLFDLEPTGAKVTITGLTLNRFANGVIVWGLVKWDRLSLLEALRATPGVSASGSQ
jgi:predicted ester cyclase